MIIPTQWPATSLCTLHLLRCLTDATLGTRPSLVKSLLVFLTFRRLPWFGLGILPHRLACASFAWRTLKPIMLQMGIYDKRELRTTVEGILYRLRVGCPWRDLPDAFGYWNAIYRRFNEWSSKEKLLKIFKSLVQNPDLEWEFIDGSYVKAHQHSSGAAHGEEAAIGQSRGGNTTKIHLATDSFGLPIEFEVTGGDVHDCKMAHA